MSGSSWADPRASLGQLAKSFSDFTTAQYHFYSMRDNGIFGVICSAPLAWVLISEGCTLAPIADGYDSQLIKTTEAGGPRGYDAGKNTTGQAAHRNRHDRHYYWAIASSSSHAH